MKNLKIIFGIALIAAITFGFTACPDPEPDEEFYVQFIDTDGGDLGIASQTVVSGKTATDPGSVIATASSVPNTQGLYTANLSFDGWTLDGATEYNFSTPVTSNIILKPLWNANKQELPTGANIIAQTVAFLNTPANQGTAAAPKKYILAIGEDISSEKNVAVTGSYIELTIIGIGSEKTITLTGNGTLLRFGGDASSSGANYSYKNRSLTLGKNITVKGNATNNNSVVWVANGSRFTMLEGSKVIGNTSSGSGYDGGSAVHIDWSEFIMDDGSVTGNSATATTASSLVTGGVCVEDNSIATLRGGSISGNTSTAAKDLYIMGGSKLTIGGTAYVADLTLGYVDTYFASITVSPGFSGKVDALNLKASATSDWNDKGILVAATGSTITADIVAKFTLGKFIGVAQTPAISTTHSINASGVLKAK